MEKSASSKIMYIQTNANIEKWSKQYVQPMARSTTPLALAFYILTTLWINETRGLQKQDLKLPFFFWFVPFSCRIANFNPMDLI